MSRLETTFKQLQSANKKALVTYIVAGDPNIETTLDAMHALVKGGADIIELGVPFSDPSAEGPVIQQAHERALANNVSLLNVFELVDKFRQTDNGTAIVLMGYANPIEWMGYEIFAERAKTAGVDAVLTVDIPPEEAQHFDVILRNNQLNNVYLLAPTSSDVRIKNTCNIANGFIYYVSLKGVTGSGKLDISDVEQRLQLIKQHTNQPICVGFGIKDAPSAAAVAACSDGVVVGSAFVERMNLIADRTQLLNVLKLQANELKTAIDSV